MIYISRARSPRPRNSHCFEIRSSDKAVNYREPRRLSLSLSLSLSFSLSLWGQSPQDASFLPAKEGHSAVPSPTVFLVFPRRPLRKIDSLFGRHKRRQRVRAYRVGTLLLRSFGHPNGISRCTPFPPPSLPPARSSRTLPSLGSPEHRR